MSLLLYVVSTLGVLWVNDERLSLFADAAGSPGQTFQHSLLLQLDAVTGVVVAAELHTPDVEVTDIGQAAASTQQGPSFVVS